MDFILFFQQKKKEKHLLILEDGMSIKVNGTLFVKEVEDVDG